MGMNTSGEGGTYIWFGQGCATQASKPYPSLRVILAEKGNPFLRIFLKNRHIVYNFGILGVFAWKFGLKSENTTHV